MSGLVEKDPAIWWGPFRMRWGDGQDVRTVQDENGAAWFVLADVCAVLQISNPRNAKVRLNSEDVNTVVSNDENGVAWFVLSDVCAVLEISNPRNAKARLNSEDVNTVHIMDGKRGNPNVTVVNESGLYDVVLDSRKPQARTFRRWITSEVVPALRATGQYTVPGHPATQPAPAPAVDPEALSVAVSAAVSQVLEPMSRVASALEHGAEVAAGVREAGS